jgi:hypothetical protein
MPKSDKIHGGYGFITVSIKRHPFLVPDCSFSKEKLILPE